MAGRMPDERFDIDVGYRDPWHPFEEREPDERPTLRELRAAEKAPAGPRPRWTVEQMIERIEASL